MNLYDYFKQDTESFILNENKELGLVSVMYSHLGVDWSLPYIQEARGLIIDFKGTIIARPYKKFFNYKQLAELPYISEELKHLSEWENDSEYVLLEKLDGSLAILSQHNSNLLVATSSSTKGNVVNNIKKYIYNLEHDINIEKLTEVTTKYTLCLEYIGPLNKQVIHYTDENLVLHGAIETETGKELWYSEVVKLADDLNISVIQTVKGYSTVDEVINDLENLENIEGFVVWFKTGKRLKLKTTEYLELHGSTEVLNNVLSKNGVEKVVEMYLDGSLDDIVAAKSVQSSLGNTIAKRTLSEINIVLSKLESIKKEFTSLLFHANTYKMLYVENGSKFNEVSKELLSSSELKTLYFIISNILREYRSEEQDIVFDYEKDTFEDVFPLSYWEKTLRNRVLNELF